MEANNMMAMRDALLKVKRLFDGRIMFQQAIREAHKAVTAALSAPPRNCDIYDAESCRMAYHLHGDGLMTMQAFADWLFAPVEEGTTNEQK